MSETNETKELYEGKFPIKFKIVGQYQLKDPDITAQFKTVKYKYVSFS